MNISGYRNFRMLNLFTICVNQYKRNVSTIVGNKQNKQNNDMIVF